MSRARSIQPGDHLGELLRAFRATADDLQANRMGQLGPGQRKRLLRSGYVNLLGTMALSAGVVAILLAVAERPLKPVQVILSGVLVAALLVLGIVMLLRSNAAAAAGDVECVAGPVHLQMRRQAGWYLTVDDRSFRLPVQFWHVQAGAPYRVYVAPKAARIIAMEPDGWG